MNQMKRWESWTVAIATMCTASSSGSLRRTLAQFARLLSPRLKIGTTGTLSVELGGIGEKKSVVLYSPLYIVLFI